MSNITRISDHRNVEPVATDGLQHLVYGAHPVRMHLDSDGEPWFVATDVCAVLDLGNAPQAVSRLDDDERNTIILNDSNRGNPQVNIVNEPGLYALILTSRKPEAKAFSRWIRHEVLPAIRKTGGYGPAAPEPPAIPTDRLKLAKDAFKIGKDMAKIAGITEKNEIVLSGARVAERCSGINPLSLLDLKYLIARRRRPPLERDRARQGAWEYLTQKGQRPS